MHKAQVLHAIDGRLRIRIGRIKNDPYLAEELCDGIRRIPGVHSATPNLVTGSITITYDFTQVSGSALRIQLARIVGAQLAPITRSTTPPSSIMLEHAGHHVARAILNTAMEAALKRAIYSLI